MNRLLMRCPLVFLLLSIAVPPSGAVVHAESIRMSGDVPRVSAGEPLAASAACNLTPGGLDTPSFFWTPPEELTSFAWKIPQSACAACQTGSPLHPTAANIRMRWFFACAAQVEVLIVGAVQGPTCKLPDPANVLCGPASYTIAGTGNATAFHTLPIPNECCVTEDAFVLLRFTGLAQCAATSAGPGLAVSTDPCVPCEQFVTANNIFPAVTEWCSAGASRLTWLSLDADCCQSTPTHGESWGTLKTIYH